MLDLAEPIHWQPVLEIRQEAPDSPIPLNIFSKQRWKWISGNLSVLASMRGTTIMYTALQVKVQMLCTSALQHKPRKDQFGQSVPAQSGFNLFLNPLISQSICLREITFSPEVFCNFNICPQWTGKTFPPSLQAFIRLSEDSFNINIFFSVNYIDYYLLTSDSSNPLFR